MKPYKAFPTIVFRIGQVVAVKPWSNSYGKVVAIHVNNRNTPYYDVILRDPYGSNARRRGRFTKGELIEVAVENG